MSARLPCLLPSMESCTVLTIASYSVRYSVFVMRETVGRTRAGRQQPNMAKVGRGSVGFAAAGGRDDAVHAQIFDHLSIVVVGVRHAEFRQAEARGFSFPNGLQHVFRRQGGGRLMTQRERGLQEFQDLGFGLYDRRADDAL